MENLDEQLRSNIEETGYKVCQAIKYAGLNSLSHLKFIQEKDLILVLRPIENRKAWSGEHNYSSQYPAGQARCSYGWCSYGNYAGDSTYSQSGYGGASTSTYTGPSSANYSGSSAPASNAAYGADPYGPCQSQYSYGQQPSASSYSAGFAQPTKILNTAPCRKRKWTRKESITLLDAYRVHKKEFSCSDDEDQNVWKNIAEEVGKKASLNCNEFQCKDKIKKLRCEFYKIGKQYITNERPIEVVFRERLRRAFKMPKKSGCCEWRKKDSLLLLEVYSRFKMEILSPDVEQSAAWSKIANEVKRESRVDCNEMECRMKISELKKEYQRIKSKDVMNKAAADFLDKARMAFETTNCPDQQSSSVKLGRCGKKNKEYHRTLLKLYTKYKTEFSSPAIEEKSVWAKIVKEMREDFLYDCGESLCRLDLFNLKTQYRDLKYSGKQSHNMPFLLDEAQKAFEIDENRVKEEPK